MLQKCVPILLHLYWAVADKACLLTTYLVEAILNLFLIYFLCLYKRVQFTMCFVVNVACPFIFNNCKNFYTRLNLGMFQTFKLLQDTVGCGYLFNSNHMHTSWQSSCVGKLLSFPPQPPYINISHWAVSGL